MCPFSGWGRADLGGEGWNGVEAMTRSRVGPRVPIRKPSSLRRQSNPPRHEEAHWQAREKGMNVCFSQSFSRKSLPEETRRCPPSQAVGKLTKYSLSKREEINTVPAPLVMDIFRRVKVGLCCPLPTLLCICTHLPSGCHRKLALQDFTVPQAVLFLEVPQ